MGSLRRGSDHTTTREVNSLTPGKGWGLSVYFTLEVYRGYPEFIYLVKLLRKSSFYLYESACYYFRDDVVLKCTVGNPYIHRIECMV